MGSYIETCKAYAIENKTTLEHAENIIEFCEEAKSDKNKKAAIERFYMNAATYNPFDEGYSYYDILNYYQDVLNEDEEDDKWCYLH